MISRFFVFCFALSILACSSEASDAQTKSPEVDADSMLAEIDSLQKLVFPNGMEAGTDTAKAWPFVRSVEVFAKAHPQHGRTANLLHDAAGIAAGTGWANKSIQLWGYVWRNQPDHPRAPEALFYQGFVFDTEINDPLSARDYYDEFLRKYPENGLAGQVRQLRELLNNRLPQSEDGTSAN